nr:hypothetical protein [Tanacetum cinerariifolium]
MTQLDSRLMKNYSTKKSFKLVVISRLPTLFFKLCFHHVIPQPTINSDLLLIQGIKPLFKMVESLFSKFKEDKVKQKVVKCYNCQGEGHIARQCTQPKRRRDASWFKENVLLVQAQAKDAYDSDCDDISSAKVFLMTNLSSCDLDVLSEDKANNESKIVDESLIAELERYKERVKILEQRINVDLSIHEKFIDLQMDDMIQMKSIKFAAFETEIGTLKQTLSKHVKEKESLLAIPNGFKLVKSRI